MFFQPTNLPKENNIWHTFFFEEKLKNTKTYYFNPHSPVPHLNQVL
jgi:hypothetical protein